MLTPFLFISAIATSACGGNLDQAGEPTMKSGSHWDSIQSSDSTYLPTGWYYVLEDSSGVERVLDRSTEKYWLRAKPIITGDHIVEFKTYHSKSGDVGLSMQLDKDGINAWSWATGRAIGGELAFVVNNRLLYVAKVNSEITNGMTALNRGIYDEEELKAIEVEIRDGWKK